MEYDVVNTKLMFLHTFRLRNCRTFLNGNFSSIWYFLSDYLVIPCINITCIIIWDVQYQIIEVMDVTTLVIEHKYYHI